MARTAIVTDAYGYYGSLVRSGLIAAGWSTVALVSEPRPGDRAAAWSLGAPPPESLLRSADALVHCAYDLKPRSRDHIWRVNVAGSTALLSAAKQVGVSRLVFVSSMSAYAGTAQLYGQAKMAIERVCLGLGGIAVRPGLVYGETPGGMAALLLKLTRLPLVPVFGKSARQFPVHEDDLADAIVGILEAPGWTPEVLGIAQPASAGIRDVLAALAERDGRSCRFMPVPWQPIYWILRLAEMTGASLPVRSDSILGLVRPATFVPRSRAFPTMLDTVRTLGEPERA